MCSNLWPDDDLVLVVATEGNIVSDIKIVGREF